MDLPELARDASEATKGTVRNLLPWLESPHTCQECNSLCYAEIVYDERQALYVDAWVCRECNSKYYREEDWAEETMHAPDFRRQ